MNPNREYQVVQFGSALRSPRPQEVEAFLNEAAAEGWEVSQMTSLSNGSKLMIILQRTVAQPIKRKHSHWP